MLELIDKEATLKKMCESCGYCEKFEKAMRTTHPEFVADKCGFYKFLAEQPAVEAEPVRYGRWIVHTTWNGMFGLIHSECSECKFDRNGDLSSWKFCPNCGADMREVSEDAGID